MFYMVDSKEECIITSDINVFNKYYCKALSPDIYKATNIIDLLRKKIETECGLNEEVTSVWNKKD